MALATQLPESWQRLGTALWQRYGRRLPALAALLFAVLLGRALADLVWVLVPAPEAARWQPPPPAPVAARPSAAPDAGAIAGAGLFGRYEAPAGGTSMLAAPDTPLNLTLIGVLADSREEFSRALISQGGNEQSYAVGDDVSRGVTLQAIFPDRVILSRNGRLETLRLERDTAGAGGDTVAPAIVADDRASNQPPQLAQIRDEVLKDPTKVTDYLRIQPANVGGQLKGYRVYPGKDRSVFSAAGLRPGDLVTSVNGVQLDDPAKAMQLITDLGQAGQVNLVVERGGQSQNISINLSQ